MITENIGIIDVDQFGIVKIFQDATRPRTYVLRFGRGSQDSEDRDHLNSRTYGSCDNSDRNNPRKSVVSTEWEKSKSLTIKK